MKSPTVIETGAGAGASNGTWRARHVAIVSDGSARWAHARGLAIADGHTAAAENVLARISDAIELGIAQLSFYAFSTENWSRPAEEVDALLGMLAQRIVADTPWLAERGVRVSFIGRRDRAGEPLCAAIESAERITAAGEVIRVFVAFDYGGRDEIVKAAARYHGGGEEAFAALLGSAGMQDPDLVIRTSGEQRLSNFLLWQCAYAELVFRAEMWPEFGREAFEECLAEYSLRQRRFGARSALPAPGSVVSRVASA